MDEILQQLRLAACGVINTTSHFMNLAEAYMSVGDITRAKACLILLCEKCGNYEESIALNDLTDQWEKYRYLVNGLVRPSVKINSIAPCAPGECSVMIDRILSMNDDDILSALSEHLGQLSGQGDALNCLNKWEKVVFFVDELWTEVNSAGIEGYLYYHGVHFEKAYTALEVIHAEVLTQILSNVRQKFPKGRIPKGMDAIQNTMDVMEEQGVDFETQDDMFYSAGESELQKCLLNYIRENQRHFR